MYTFKIEGIENTNQYEELIKVFLSPGEFKLIKEDDLDIQSSELQSAVVFSFKGDKEELKRDIYRFLQKETGKTPKWGILTGIRPVKLAGEMTDLLGRDETLRRLSDEYLLHPEKTELITNILDYQRRLLGKPQKNSLSIYAGIPFCPTRCLYCSFTSNQVKKPEIDRYLQALHKEIEYCGEKLRSHEIAAESLYIGGGTPTTLDEAQLEVLLDKLRSCFDMSELKEFTVEAGRPDTITREKLEVMKAAGVGRISINPQSMKQHTLDLIGRAHTTEETVKAFELAGKVGFECINADLIAGLPEEDVDDFKDSLDTMIGLGAENITVHTLAVKRASRLKEMDDKFNYRREEVREAMLAYAHSKLKAEGYVPYYLYRQKHTSGNTENIGFCKNDLISPYNVRIMEEAQSILALGAGGISKVYYPDENRLERVANVSNYEIYIDRIDEMIERKENNFWR
ncbi:MAG: coproporphyrinogen dehydrogenase HemZ [Bacillota bacterium]|nr:coproporphyrinogen dehydrogenase HemZ [Bacillota bacterium]